MVSLLESIERHRVIAIVRGNEPQAVLGVCQTLLSAGIKIIEVPLTTPNACEVITQLSREAAEDVLVGAGTVLTPSQLDEVRAAGGSFIVTPAICPAVQAAVDAKLPVLCGAFTATEVYQAFNMGVTAVKLFPASAGGPSYLKALRDPFPNIPLIAVGGVGAQDVPGYLAAGAVGVGVGGPLVGDVLQTGDLVSLASRARSFLDAIA